MFTVYVLYSLKYDKIYIGFTSDIKSRILSHNEKAKKGWTIRFRPWEIIYTEEKESKKDAMDREKQLKSSRGRDWIRNTLMKE